MICFLLMISNARQIKATSDDNAEDNSSKSEAIEESKEIERKNGRRDGHRKIHIITVKKVKDVEQKGTLISVSIKHENL